MVKGGIVPILLQNARKFESTDENDKADKDSNDKVVRGATCVLVSLANRCEESRCLMLQNNVGPLLAIRMLEKSASPDQERLSMELIRNLSPWAADVFVPVVKLLIDKAEMILDNFPHTSHNINYFRVACFKALYNICKHSNEARKTLAYDSRCVNVIMKISESGYFATGFSLMKYVLKVVCNRDDVYSTTDQVHEPLDIMKLTVRKFYTAGAIELLVGELNTNINILKTGKWSGVEARNLHSHSAGALFWRVIICIIASRSSSSIAITMSTFCFPYLLYNHSLLRFFFTSMYISLPDVLAITCCTKRHALASPSLSLSDICVGAGVSAPG